jgi:hypothetical protein
VTKNALEKVAEEVGDEIGTTVKVFQPGTVLEPV